MSYTTRGLQGVSYLFCNEVSCQSVTGFFMSYISHEHFMLLRYLSITKTYISLIA